jgi:glycosyltransferase involved in cell wall biosynthesis
MNKERPTLSAIVIALNEEKNIQRCLESLAWTDEIILVDSGSTDRTKELASKYTNKIFDFEWNGFGRSKEYVKSKASGKWVLSIDCDEVISDKLKDEILTEIDSSEKLDGYFIPRKSNFLGKWIKHSGWHPDYILRLFKKDRGSFTPDKVHEKVIVNGLVGYLKNEILHYTDPDLEHYLAKLNQYTTVSASEMHQQGKRGNVFDITFRPAGTFFKMYFLKAGFLDGVEGFLLAFCSAFHVFFKYAKLWHLNKNKL